jgi:mRNA interferase MazF
MRRYEIRWARLDPIEGSEMGKTRPVVIVSMDVFNDKLRTLTVCPITTQLHPQWRARLAIQCAGRDAEIAVDQIRTLARKRVGPLIDCLSPDIAASLRRLISQMYGEEQESD